ncbi:hypothetical protein WN55_08006 [Dufourea novaeangliae]|uniref:Uncharacterized protein n=1 Tax=Dufourea novaeangliae TaxID=178035 RepID=A0A154P6W5_DUFNO|nr:hypothetical protein WN55_08006 [Dufourea novaeangliae]
MKKYKTPFGAPTRYNSKRVSYLRDHENAAPQKKISTPRRRLNIVFPAPSTLK